jgi:NADH dehydrogenase FAD-containing subunit
VELLTAGTLGADLSAEGAAHVRQVMHHLGIRIHDGAKVTHLTDGAAHLADGSRMPFDVAVWTSGFRVSPLATEAGLPVNQRGQIMTDASLRAVDHTNLFAVGDAAEAYGVGDDPLRMACATAMPMAAHAADNLARLLQGETPEPFGFRYVIRCISLGRKDALVQTVDGADRPRPRITTGWQGALVKEGICRFVVYTILLERNLRRPVFDWPKPKVARRVERHDAYDSTLRPV